MCAAQAGSATAPWVRVAACFVLLLGLLASILLRGEVGFRLGFGAPKHRPLTTQVLYEEKSWVLELWRVRSGGSRLPHGSSSRVLLAHLQTFLLFQFCYYRFTRPFFQYFGQLVLNMLTIRWPRE